MALVLAAMVTIVLLGLYVAAKVLQRAAERNEDAADTYEAAERLFNEAFAAAEAQEERHEAEVDDMRDQIHEAMQRSYLRGYEDGATEIADHLSGRNEGSQTRH